jgi:hypothetical protein
LRCQPFPEVYRCSTILSIVSIGCWFIKRCYEKSDLQLLPHALNACSTRSERSIQFVQHAGFCIQDKLINQHLTKRYLFSWSWFLFLSSFPTDSLVLNFIVNLVCLSIYEFQIFHDIYKFYTFHCSISFLFRGLLFAWF